MIRFPSYIGMQLGKFGECTNFVKPDLYLRADCKDDEIDFKYYNDGGCTDRNRDGGKTEIDTKPGEEVQCQNIGHGVYVYLKQTGWECKGEKCPQEKKDPYKKEQPMSNG